MNTKTRMVQQLLGAAHENGEDMSVSRARRLIARHLNEPDPVAYCLTYSDPVGERATALAMRSRC